MDCKKITGYILGLPKTLIFNFKYFPFRTALKLPVLVSKNVCLDVMKGSIELPQSITSGMIKLGFGDVGIFDRKRSRTVWRNGGRVIFKGKCEIGHGSKISVGKNAVLSFGNNFTITAESSIAYEKEITFGDNVLVSWECLFMDTDYHPLMIDGALSNEDRPIHIGNNVWICCRNLIFKGSEIPAGCVIAAGSLVSGKIEGESCLAGGRPCRILRQNVSWSPATQTD